MDRMYAIHKLPICPSCKHVAKPLISNNTVQFVDNLEAFIIAKNAANSL